MKKAITVNNLTKVFETKKKGMREKELFTAVDNISFEVNQGEIIGFIGPNGAGKSTTIKMLTGILFPTSGEAIVEGYNPWKERNSFTYEIATMFGQKSSLIAHLPVIESYRLLGAIYDIDKKTLDERIKETIDFFDISHLLNKKASSLSLGQRTICEVAAVTLHRPKIIFLDEPTIGLDLVAKKKVRDMIFTLNEKYNTTIFITSHDIADIEKLCSRIIIINHGKIMLDQKINELRDTYFSKKKLVVTFDENVGEEKIREILSKENVRVEVSENILIEYDENIIQVGSVIAKLLGLGSISNMEISSASLENVIFEIYTDTN